MPPTLVQNSNFEVFHSVQHFSAIFMNLYSIFPLFDNKSPGIMASEMTRLDLRISQKQKTDFEQALELGGFRSLTDFLISAASEKAEAIMEKHNNWLVSENDRKIFFDALLNPPAPNARLKAAMKRHSELVKK